MVAKGSGVSKKVLNCDRMSSAITQKIGKWSDNKDETENLSNLRWWEKCATGESIVKSESEDVGFYVTSDI